uniref:Lipocalin/cytosolic fatty-acid binding domain-containing protein n=1 Tax=Amblyomma maculatum TaxID=34609 RepID=G3MQZ6_AMBMU
MHRFKRSLQKMTVLFYVLSRIFNTKKNAMIAVFVVHILASSRITLAMRFEDDINYAVYQRASDFTAPEEMLWVTKQSQRNELVPKTLCQAMLKLRSTGGGSFLYAVYYALPTARTEVKAFVTTLTTGRAAAQNGYRVHQNTVSYQTVQGGLFFRYKVLYADPRHGCFILVAFGPSAGRACRLLQTSSTVNQGIPEMCNKVYREHCAQDTKVIYYPICWSRLPHIVQWGN